MRWTGRPARRPVFDATDWLSVPVSILTVGIALYAQSRMDFNDTFGLIVRWVVIAFGAYVVVGRLIVRWVALLGTTYTITDRRVLVETNVFGLTHRESHYFQALPSAKVVERSGGLGDVRFGKASWQRGDRGWSVVPAQLELRAIAEPHRVARLFPYPY